MLAALAGALATRDAGGAVQGELNQFLAAVNGDDGLTVATISKLDRQSRAQTARFEKGHDESTMKILIAMKTFPLRDPILRAPRAAGAAMVRAGAMPPRAGSRRGSARGSTP